MKVQEKKIWKDLNQTDQRNIFPWGKFEDCEMGRSRKTKNLSHNECGKCNLFSS